MDKSKLARNARIINSTRIGFNVKEFQMAKPFFEEERELKVRRQLSKFKVKVGNLVFNGKELKKTFVLEIDFEEVMNQHRKKLPMHGFNSSITVDYAEVANQLALDICAEKGWVANNHINSCPVFQAIVSIEG